MEKFIGRSRVAAKRRSHQVAQAANLFFESLENRTLLAAVKIMPLGDSITEAFTNHASYRYWLFNKLATAGYDVDFVGSMTGVSGGAPLFSNFDQNHEGHSGWRADEVQANIINWANTSRPDVVLLHIGTNDVEQGQSNSGTINEISGTIDNLRSVLPNVKILLAQVIPANGFTSQVNSLNGLISTLAGQKNTAQSPVILVNQNSGFNVSTDTYDGIHPDESGEIKMSDKWYSALVPLLAPPTPPTQAYVSDLNWTSQSNGWGNAERDRSNGESGSADGRTITLNGLTYAKGLGVHAASDIVYSLTGGNTYTEFRSDIGVDDEVGNSGSVIFQVYVDNVLRYTSPTMTGSSSTQSIVVPVSGASTLRLVVTDAGNGNAFDHADWANAKLIIGAPVPAPSAPTGLGAALNGAKADLNWTDASSDETGFRIERKTGSGGTWSQIGSVGAGVTTYSDTTIAQGNTYYYRVYAYNGGGGSLFSNEANVNYPVPPPPPGQAYLSDLNYVVVSNGWGLAEKDRSNGESGSTDGKTITLNGVTYTKGIGVHAASDITFNLAGGYTQFFSDVGVDDEVGNNGSVIFQVYLDGVLAYTSGSMTGATATKSINLAVQGKSTLRLVVTDGGNGNAYDHADWANARLIAGEPVPAPSAPTGLDAVYNNGQVALSWTDASTDETGFRVQRRLGAAGSWTDVQTLAAGVQSWTDNGPFNPNSAYDYRVIAFNAGGDSGASNISGITTPQASEVWLSDLNWSSATNGWGAVEKDRSNGETGSADGQTIAIRGNTYAKGLGTHADSDIRYNLGGNYTSFISDIGIDNETGGNGSVIFRVYVDGVLKYDSGIVRGADAVKSINISLAGAQTLWLVATTAGDGASFDHADWAGAKLIV